MDEKPTFEEQIEIEAAQRGPLNYEEALEAIDKLKKELEELDAQRISINPES